MISRYFSRRLALLAAVSSALLLAACGGGGDDDDDGTTTVRAINLTTDLPSVDLYTDDDKRFSALAADVMSAEVNFEADTYSLKVKREDESATLYSDSFALAKDAHYTAVIIGRESEVVVRTIPEDEDDEIDAGEYKLRVYNMTADAGGIDVFITQPATDISDMSPTLRFTSNSLSDFMDLATADTLRLRVTGVGNPTDIRLDVTLSGAQDAKYHTLVVTSGLSGALANAVLIPQRGTATMLKNTKARVRVAAGVDSTGNVATTIGGATVLATLRSPSVSAYALVNAGTQNMTVRYNGTVVDTRDRNFVPGADYTVLAFGSVAAPQLAMLADDNRLPSTSSRAKIRLVNAVAGSEPMTLQLDYLPLASEIAVGTASGYLTANSSGSTRAEVSSLSAVEPLFVAIADSDEPLLQAQGVYTVFMLGGSTTAPATGVLRKDR